MITFPLMALLLHAFTYLLRDHLYPTGYLLWNCPSSQRALISFNRELGTAWSPLRRGGNPDWGFTWIRLACGCSCRELVWLLIDIGPAHLKQHRCCSVGVGLCKKATQAWVEHLRASKQHCSVGSALEFWLGFLPWLLSVMDYDLEA